MAAHDEAIAAAEYAMARCAEVPAEGAEFAESVRGKLLDISNTIARTGRVTDNQRRAIDNMAAGVERWLGKPTAQ